MTAGRAIRNQFLLTKHAIALCWSSDTAVGIGANADVDPVVCSHCSSAPTATSPWRLVPISARIPSGLEVDGLSRFFSGQKGAQLRFPDDERPTLDDVHYGCGCGGRGWIKLQIGLVAQGRLEAFEVLIKRESVMPSQDAIQTWSDPPGYGACLPFTIPFEPRPTTLWRSHGLQ